MIKKRIKNKYLKRSFFIMCLIILWEIIYSTKLFPVQLFPSFIQILKSLFNDLMYGKLLIQTLDSLLLIFKGLTIGLFIAFFLCYFGYFSNLISEIIDALIAILDPLPGVAILPLVILWIGIGEKAILFIILHSIIWPIVISIQTGFKGIDKIYIEVAKNNEISNFQLFYYILIPLSLPQIVSGIKIGWSRSWRALISSEMIFGAIGSLGGIGWYLFEKRVFMDTSGMFAGLIILMAISVFIEDIIFLKIEKYIRNKII